MINVDALVRMIEDCLPFCGSTGDLPMLAAVHLDVSHGWLTASGTNRYALAQSRCRVSTDDPHEDGTLLLGRDQALRLARSYKLTRAQRGSWVDPLRLSLSESETSLGFRSLFVEQLEHPLRHELGALSMNLPALDEKWVDPETIMSAKPDPTESVAIDGRYLIEIGKRKRHVTEAMRIVLAGPQRPMIVHLGSADDDDQLRVAVMPVRHGVVAFDNWEQS